MLHDGGKKEEKVFEEKRNYRSDLTGMSVRLKSELVFEMGRNLQQLGQLQAEGEPEEETSGKKGHGMKGIYFF